MGAILDEVVAVANAQEIALDRDERMAAITGLLEKAVGGKASMLQDVEAERRTEIDVINGAIVDAGRRYGHRHAVQPSDGLDDSARTRGEIPGEERMTARLEISGLGKSFPGVRALDAVSMTVERGEMRALLGENGAGKSTLAKVLAGVYARDAGQVLVDGEEIGDLDERAAGDRHRAPGRLARAAAQRGREHLRRSAGWSGVFGQVDRAMRARAGALIAQLGIAIDPSRRVAQLSPARAGPGGGDRQGAVASPVHPRSRRADRRADADRNRTAVRDRAQAGGERGDGGLRLAPARRGESSRSATASRC